MESSSSVVDDDFIPPKPRKSREFYIQVKTHTHTHEHAHQHPRVGGARPSQHPIISPKRRMMTRQKTPSRGTDERRARRMRFARQIGDTRRRVDVVADGPSTPWRFPRDTETDNSSMTRRCVGNATRDTRHATRTTTRMKNGWNSR